MKKIKWYSQDNTQGFSDAELAVLNGAVDELAARDGLDAGDSEAIEVIQGRVWAASGGGANLSTVADLVAAVDRRVAAATELGRAGGSSTSAAKTAAARANGAKGGRPKLR